MTCSISTPTIPSEYDDEVDEASLPWGQIWAYPCKLALCPDYGTTWTLRSNFILHLYEEEAHGISAATPAARRAIELNWRYMTDLHLPPRAAPNFRSREDPEEHVWKYSFRDGNGKVVSGQGTLRQMERHKASRGIQAERRPDVNLRSS